MSIELFPSSWITEEHRMLQDSAARFFRERWVPRAAEFRQAAGRGEQAQCHGADHGTACGSLHWIVSPWRLYGNGMEVTR